MGAIQQTVAAIGAAAAPSTLLDDLVAFWKLNEASGTRNDSIGTNHLADNNTVTQAGDAAQFTRANSEFLSIADNATVSTGDVDFSIGAWVYLDSKPADEMHIVSKDAVANREYCVRYNNTNDRFDCFVTDGSTFIDLAASSLGSPSISTWYFILFWHNAATNTLNICVNDGTVNSQATSGIVPADAGAQFRIGARQYAGFEAYFDGRIKKVGFWKRVLTAAEITEAYGGGNGWEP